VSRVRGDRFSAVSSRHVAVILLAAVGLSSCATFTEANVVARVGDATLEREQLDELILSATPGAEPDDRIRVPMSTAHNLLNTWILTEVLRSDLERADGAVTEEQRQQATAQLEANFGPEWATATPAALRQLQIEQQAAIAAWTELEVPTPSESELRSLYQLGPERSGVMCTAHILVATAEEAAEVSAELAAGAEFDQLAAERSIDPGSATAGGALPCATTAEFEQTYISEFVEAALDARIGVPTSPVQSQFGYHIIVVRPFEEVRDEGVAELITSEQARFRRATRSTEISVDPRYGTFDPDAGVIAIG
jgi:hypothetical protein